MGELLLAILIGIFSILVSQIVDTFKPKWGWPAFIVVLTGLVYITFGLWDAIFVVFLNTIFSFFSFVFYLQKANETIWRRNHWIKKCIKNGDYDLIDPYKNPDMMDKVSVIPVYNRKTGEWEMKYELSKSAIEETWK